MDDPSSSNQNDAVIVKDSNKEVKVTFEPNTLSMSTEMLLDFQM